MVLKNTSFIALFALTIGATSPALAITLEEVVTLSKFGMPAEKIIERIEADRTIFNLKLEEIVELKKSNVPENVIQFILSTPRLYGDGVAAPASTTTSAPEASEPAEPEVEETEEEREAREEAAREEDAQVEAAEAKRRAAQREAYADGVLAKGRQLADRGKFIESIKAFQEFQQRGNYPAGSREAYLANFGIANALVKAGLYQAAARQLVEILRAGPERQFFQDAFQQLRELRKKVNYRPATLDELTEFFVGSFSQSFQDEYNYVLGEFFYDSSNWAQATTYLTAVTSSAADHGKAQYLIGLISVRDQKYGDAVSAFQNAIIATEENNSDPEIRDLAYLALARIAYYAKQHDAAIYYYRKVPKESYKRATAFYESGWVFFKKEDWSRALGTFQTLHSPYYAHQFYPELWLLESAVYMRTCRFDDAQEALARFNTDVTPIIEPLKKFLLKPLSPEQYYVALVETIGGKTVHGLNEALIAPILSNVDFYNLYKTIKQIESELDRLTPFVDELGPFGSELRDLLVNLHRDRVLEIGIRIMQVLREVDSTLASYQEKADFMAVDLSDLKDEEFAAELQAIGSGEKSERMSQATVGGANAIVGGDSWEWSYEGEFWSDEIGTYRAFFENLCPAPSVSAASQPE